MEDTIESLSSELCHSFRNTSDSLHRLMSKLGVPLPQQQHQLTHLVHQTISTLLKNEVSLQSAKEAAHAAKNEKVFVEIFALTRRLRANVENFALGQLVDVLDARLSEERQKRGTKRLRDKNTPERIITNATSRRDASDELYNDVSLCCDVTDHIPSFSINATTTTTTQPLTFLCMSLTEQSIILEKEEKRLLSVAKERIEHLNLVQKQRQILHHVPFTDQDAVRSMHAVQLFGTMKTEIEEHHAATASSTSFHSRDFGTCRSASGIPIQEGSNKSEVERLGIRQDLSLDRVTREANHVFNEMQNTNRNISAAVHDCMEVIASYWAMLTGIPEETKFNFTTKINRRLKQMDSNVESKKFEDSALYHQYPESVARLYLVRSPCDLFAEVLRYKAELQSEIYDDKLVQFSDLQDRIVLEYRQFYALSCDPRFQSCTDYNTLLLPPMNITASGKSFLHAASLIAQQTTTRQQGAKNTKVDPRHVPAIQLGTCLDSTSARPSSSTTHSSSRHGGGGGLSGTSGNSSSRSTRSVVEHFPIGSTQTVTNPSIDPQATEKAADIAFLDRITRLDEVTTSMDEDLKVVTKLLSTFQTLRPLLQRRDEIILKKRQLEDGGKERLLNKRVNMAKQLLEEEQVRRAFQRELPKICEQLSALCEEWEKEMGQPLIAKGFVVVEELNNTSTLLVLEDVQEEASRPPPHGGSTTQKKNGCWTPPPPSPKTTVSSTPLSKMKPNHDTVSVKPLPSRAPPPHRSGTPTPRRILVNTPRADAHRQHSSLNRSHSGPPTPSSCRTPRPLFSKLHLPLGKRK